MTADKAPQLLLESIESKIFVTRGHRVMLDEDLAVLYEVEIKALNQAVKRNLERFPDDFMFQLTAEEFSDLKSQTGDSGLRSQTVTLKSGRGQHRKYLPYAFTEQGVAMLSSVLRSERAIHVNIEIMRAFVRLRQMLSTLSPTLSRLRGERSEGGGAGQTKRYANFTFAAELSRKLAVLEKKYDARFKTVFEAIHDRMSPPEQKLIACLSI